MFHRTRDAIEAHLTIVLTGLAIANVIKQLRPLRSATIVNGQVEVPAGGQMKVPTPCGDS
jgi:hypothetical protein